MNANQLFENNTSIHNCAFLKRSHVRSENEHDVSLTPLRTTSALSCRRRPTRCRPQHRTPQKSCSGRRRCRGRRTACTLDRQTSCPAAASWNARSRNWCTSSTCRAPPFQRHVAPRTETTPTAGAAYTCNDSLLAWPAQSYSSGFSPTGASEGQHAALVGR